MKILTFIKQKWNLISGLALSIVFILTKIITPPDFSDVLTQSTIDYNTFAKFIVAGVIILALVPFEIFNKKKNGVWWWASGLMMMALSIVMLIRYYDVRNKYSAQNK